MLYRLHNNIFIVGLLALGFLAVLASSRAFCAVTPLTLFAFVTQVALLIRYTDEERNTYSEQELFLVVFFYGLLLAGLIISCSHFFYGDEFLWEDPDGVFYYEEGMKSRHLGVLANMHRIVTRYGFDDWGALLLSALAMYVVPSSFFMNFLHVLTGAVSALLLFRIGKRMMPRSYAFMAALGYSTSSYLIMFHCTYLKESFFTFFVICAMYFFYESIADRRRSALVWVMVFLVVIAFYRPALVVLLLAGFVGYYAVTQRGSALSLFLYVVIAVALVASMAFMQSQMDHYTEGGNSDELLAENGSANYSGGFNYFVGWFASLFGPFPSLFPNTSQGVRTMNMYGAGLTYKLFLAVPLWTGVYYAVKRFNVMLIPLLGFTLAEMAASGYIMASFELRKVMLHMPFTYIAAFYGLHELEASHASVGIRKFLELCGHAFTIGILLLWTVVRVK